jgi:hypothetical protein
MQQLYNSQGIAGIKKETVGNSVLVQLAPEQWDVIEDALDKEDGLVSQEVICKELGICKKTLANLIACGKITRKMYVTAVNGVKKFWYRKIMGIEQ